MTAPQDPPDDTPAGSFGAEPTGDEPVGDGTDPTASDVSDDLDAVKDDFVPGDADS